MRGAGDEKLKEILKFKFGSFFKQKVSQEVHSLLEISLRMLDYQKKIKHQNNWFIRGDVFALIIIFRKGKMEALGMLFGGGKPTKV